jgi:hypothetical protein
MGLGPPPPIWLRPIAASPCGAALTYSSAGLLDDAEAFVSQIGEEPTYRFQGGELIEDPDNRVTSHRVGAGRIL